LQRNQTRLERNTTQNQQELNQILLNKSFFFLCASQLFSLTADIADVPTAVGRPLYPFVFSGFLVSSGRLNQCNIFNSS